jgi:dihydrofolate synthase/folylpolyglutamate synthase
MWRTIRAAAALAQNLDNMGFHPYTYAVFGSMLDKDIRGVLAHMGGKVDHWMVTDLPLPRAATAQQLEEKLRASGALNEAEKTVSCFTSPEEAYLAAVSKAGENDRIVVFGSFLTVAGAMRARRAR